MVEDWTGRVFGLLTVVGPTEKREHRRTVYRCRCECGTEVEVPSDRLRRKDQPRIWCCVRNHAEMHGLRRPPDHPMFTHPLEYGSWISMRSRCHPVSGRKDYGQRGITVCDRWQDFGAFLSDIGSRPTPEHTIERLDVNGNYEPGNCVWATAVVQARNTRRTLYVDWRGSRHKLAVLAETHGIPRKRVWMRLNQGWSLEDALMRPVASGSRGGNRCLNG